MANHAISPPNTLPAERVVGLNRLIAVLPEAVDESMRAAIPHLYTPELAAAFTAAMIAELRNPQADVKAQVQG